MTGTQPTPTRDSQRRRRRSQRGRRRLTVVIAGVLCGALAATVATALMLRPWESPSPADAGAGTGATATPTGSATPTPEATPLTAAEQLLADADDPAACAIVFDGDGIGADPMLQTEGTLFAGLPLPEREGTVFAGWYESTDAAAALSIDGRVNGSELVTCDDSRQRTLHGAWMSPDDNAAVNARIPILMYHQFTDRPEGEDGWLRLNYAYVGDFRAHMEHIATGGFYLPTWDELSAFIDGKLFLPDHSVIVTDDDADQSWFDLAVPVVDEFGVLSTSFMITADRQDAAPSPYVLRRSHTHDMHQAGANGEGRMVNWSAAEIAADMKTSADVLGVAEVMAYPFGHHNETSKEGLREAGFELARTIEQGYVTIGTDKLALPCIRINYGMGLDALTGLIG